MMRTARLIATSAAALALAGCYGPQSALAPRGDEAERVHTLFWVMTIGGGVIFLGVLIVAALAIFGRGRVREWIASPRTIFGAGLVFPAATLTVLLAYGLLVMAARAPAPDGAVFARISGEQWWWRVTYVLPDGREVESANELRIPVGQPVALALETADVIHSFWVPQLAGKLDMIPGRTNVLTLHATSAGISRGQCAEYCGGAHAFMAFHVVAMPPEAFSAWLEQEAGPARVAAADGQAEGYRIFDGLGCGGCHSIRGTSARGSIGPDLTHVGGRLSLAAATLPNTAEAFASWITDNQHIKPENRMPAYQVLAEDELVTLSRYLESLE